MTEKNDEEDGVKIKLFQDSLVNREQLAGMKQLDNSVSSSFKKAISLSERMRVEFRSVNTLRERMGVDIAQLKKAYNTNFEPLRAAARIPTESVSAMQLAMDSIRESVGEALTTATFSARISDELVEQFKLSKSVAEKLGENNTIQLAGAFRGVSVFADNYSKDTSVDEETKEKVHVKLVEHAEKVTEETGQPIPYNVFSMKLVVGLYIPSMSAYEFLSDADSLDSQFVARLILYHIIPLIYFLASYKDDKPAEIVFRDDDEKN